MQQTKNRIVVVVREIDERGRERDVEDTNSALKKAFAILEAIVESSQPLGIPDLCLHLGLSRQTVHRVIQQLEELSLIRRDLGRERYIAGSKVAQIGQSALVQSYRWGSTRAVLESVVEKVQETCNLGMLDGNRAIYIDRVECNWPLRMQLAIGSRVHLHCTAVGKLLLAYMPEEERKNLVGVLPLPRFTKNTLTTRSKLLAATDEIVARGYSTNVEEDMTGMIAVAVPIMDERGQVVAGLALHALVGRLSLKQAVKLVPVLRKAADQIQKLQCAVEPER